MIELKIDDPDIEEVYHSSEDIIKLLKSIVKNEVEIIPLKPKEAFTQTRIVQILNDYFSEKPVLKAYLFGSYSRGEASPDSDIDILLELDDSQKIGKLFFKMAEELKELTGKKIDLLSDKAINEKIKENIFRERVLVYERRN